MIDISNIKPGDKGTIEITFGDLIGIDDPVGRGGSVRVEWPWGASSWLAPDQISHCSSHTPAPREIKVGDRVTCRHFTAAWYDVKAIDDGYAWLGGKAVAALRDLRHYQEPT